MTPKRPTQRVFTCRQAVGPLMALFICSGALGQGRKAMDYEINAGGYVLSETTGEPVKGAIIAVKRDGHSQDLIITGTDGSYVVPLQRGSHYEIVYSATGMVAKRVEISTKGAPAQLDAPAINMQVDISLFAPLKGLSAELFDKPLGRAHFDTRKRDIVWDEEYGKATRNAIRVFMTRYDALLEKREAMAGR